MSKSQKVPKAMQDKFDSITEKTDEFCEQHLNEEYKAMIRSAVAALCRKRPSPLLRGRVNTWASGVIHAIGTANFLFDRSQTPYCKSSDIASHFGIASGTSTSKSKEIRDLLKIRHFSTDWTLPSRMDQNPLAWMVEVNGFITDVRNEPLEIQEIAYQKGFIPYMPGDES